MPRKPRSNWTFTATARAGRSYRRRLDTQVIKQEGELYNSTLKDLEAAHQKGITLELQHLELQLTPVPTGIPGILSDTQESFNFHPETGNHRLERARPSQRGNRPKGQAPPENTRTIPDYYTGFTSTPNHPTQHPRRKPLSLHQGPAQPQDNNSTANSRPTSSHPRCL